MGPMSTYTKSLLYLGGVAVLSFGVYLLVNSEIDLPSVRSAKADAGSISCDFSGITYQEGQARMSEDGCNICTCTETGWSCTGNACFDRSMEGAGGVSGTLAKVDGIYVTDRVCAIDLTTAERHCVEVLKDAPSYAIRLPVGRYWIYAEDDSRDDGYKAYYSARSVCTGPVCGDHSPLAVEVKEGEVAEASPDDWDMRGWIDRVSITPSKRQFDSNYYNPGAKINIRARDMEEIEFFYLFIKITAQDNDTVPKSIGKAELVETDDKGWQHWTLPLPDGFTSSRLWPDGRAVDGTTMRGWDLGRTKPEDVPVTTEWK